MPSHETFRQRAERASRATRLRIGEELRVARVGAGLSRRELARRLGMSHSLIGRIERAEVRHLSIDRVATLALAVGLTTHVGLYPRGSPLRDAAHVALLARFRGVLAAAVTIRFEVPIPMAGDLRHADAVVELTTSVVMIEAETRLDDSQALVRRIRGKQRDLGCARVILVLAETRHNHMRSRPHRPFGPSFRSRHDSVSPPCVPGLTRVAMPSYSCDAPAGRPLNLDRC